MKGEVYIVSVTLSARQRICMRFYVVSGELGMFSTAVSRMIPSWIPAFIRV